MQLTSILRFSFRHGAAIFTAILTLFIALALGLAPASAQTPTWQTEVGEALVFDQANSQIINNVDLEEGSFTLRFSLYSDRSHTARTNWEAVIHKGDRDLERTPGLWLAPHDDYLYFALSTNNIDNHFGRSAQPVPTGTWVDVLYTLDVCAKEVRLYFDGVLEARLPYSGRPVFNDGLFRFGQDPRYSSFRGRLRDIRIYDQVAQPEFPIRWTFQDDSLLSEPSRFGLRYPGLPVQQASLRGNALALDTLEQGIRVESVQPVENSTLRLRIRLREDSTGHFRSIVHKGNSNEQRTPGLWLDQNSRRLLFATSTDQNWNEFGRSNRELPLNEWVDVALVISDASRDAQLYINGELDASLTLRSSVQENSGQLYVGRSPWYHSFVGDLESLELSYCATSQEEFDNTEANESMLGDISSYAMYTGPLDENRSQITTLSQYDMVIIEAEHFTREQIDQIQATGTTVIGYVSFGEQQRDRRATAQRTQGEAYNWDVLVNGQPMINPEFPDAYFVNPTANWQNYVTTVLMPEVITQKGCDGVFMDTLDTVDRFAAFGANRRNLRSAFVGLVEAARSAFPNQLLLANRGFTLLPDIANDIDAVIFESFTQPNMLDTGGNLACNNQHVAWTRNRVHELACHGISALSLDYQDSFPNANSTSLIPLLEKRARDHGMVPFVTAQSLQTLP